MSRITSYKQTLQLQR